MTKAYADTIEGEALRWPPTTAVELERFWVQRDHRYVLRHHSIMEGERSSIFAARRQDIDSLPSHERDRGWRMLDRWVLPHL